MTSEGSGTPRVVAGVDGSAESVAELTWAVHYAAATGATVRAILAWHYPTAASVPPVRHVPEAVRVETEQRVQATLDQAISQAFDGQPSAGVEQVIVYGHPAETLIEASKEADLLVVGSRGHGAFTGMLVGSVSIHCVTGAFCPVVVVRGH